MADKGEKVWTGCVDRSYGNLYNRVTQSREIRKMERLIIGLNL